LPDDLARAYKACLDAQTATLAEVRAGASTRGLHETAHRVIEEAGAPHLQHGVGHGVGLEIHEAPVLRRDSEGDLVAGNVVTIEPGVYLPGRGGVRIEDLVIVTDEGAEVLTPFTKDLLTLD
jgi:Xaa-Pro aminopeptidase